MNRHQFIQITMKKYKHILITFGLIILAAIVLTIGLRTISPGNNSPDSNKEAMVSTFPEEPGSRLSLPEPTTDGSMSLEMAISLRRSTRTYANQPLSIKEVSQLLWSAQGITNERGFRTAPSAGATFPLEIFVVVNNVEGLKKGIYHYHPHEHALLFVRDDDVSADLARACLSQSMITDGGIVIIFAAEFERTTARYGERGIRYVYNEIGHASQNVHLQAASLNLGTVVIGAYRDEEVEEILQLEAVFRVLYLMPIGKI